ncbi:hypothetical protein ATER59S_04223 [Aquamicrobium terrae]
MTKSLRSSTDGTITCSRKSWSPVIVQQDETSSMRCTAAMKVSGESSLWLASRTWMNTSTISPSARRLSWAENPFMTPVPRSPSNRRAQGVADSPISSASSVTGLRPSRWRISSILISKSSSRGISTPYLAILGELYHETRSKAINQADFISSRA